MHTNTTRAAISETMRARWAQRQDPARREADYKAYRAAFAAIARGPADPALLRLLAPALLRTAPEAERPRWQRWQDAIESGRRVKVATLRAEIFVGDDAPLGALAADLQSDEGVRGALHDFNEVTG